MTALVENTARDRRVSLARRRLLDVGEGLGWPGTLADMDSWPADALVQDVRWRLASDRALVGVGGALTDGPGDSPDVSADVERICMDPVPIVDWPATVGWGDNERRYALRHHAGRLRILHELLGQRLIDGLASVPPTLIDTWQEGLTVRRRECLDALVALRLEERLTWRGEPHTWDHLFRGWLEFVRRLDPSFAPPGPRAALRAAAEDIAAVAAQTSWWASSYGTPASQSFAYSIPAPPTLFTLHSTPAGFSEPAADVARSVVLGLIAQPGRASVRLAWTGFGNGDTSGAAIAPADEALAQAIAPRSR